LNGEEREIMQSDGAEDCFQIRGQKIWLTRARAGKSSARGYGDKDWTIAQPADFSFLGHIERPTSSNDVIYPRLQRRGHGEVMHGSSNDHKI